MRAKTINTLIEADDKSSNSVSTVSRYLTRPFLISLCSLSLVACEAPLELDKVAEEKNKSLRRSDQLMAIEHSADRVIAVGSDGLVLHRAIKDQQWQRIELEGAPNFVALERCANGDLLALSMERQVWASSDHGLNWQSSTIDTPESLISLHCGPDNSVWLGGSFSTLIHRKNGEQDWQELSLNEDASISHIQFFDTQNAIALGEFGLVAHTKDGGQSWQLAEPMPDEFFPMGAYFKNPKEGWAAGLGGLIYHSEDGGHSWQKESTPKQSPLYGFDASSELLAFGDHGTVLKRVGNSWEAVKTPAIPIFFRDGSVDETNTLSVVGGWGLALDIDLVSQ